MTVQPYARFDLLRGYIDPNPLLSPFQLYGQTPYSKGTLYQIREAWDVVRQCMDDRRRAMTALTYRVVPRATEPTVMQSIAADMVQNVLDDIDGRSLSSLIAEIDDRVASYGHAAAEMSSPLGDRVRFTFVEAYQVREWLTDPSRLRLRGVVYDSGIGWQSVNVPELVWFGREIEAGNLWGSADLRGLLAKFAAAEQELRLHLAGRVLEAGILYTHSTEQGASADDVNRAMEWQSRLYSGQPAPLHFPLGMKPGTISVDSKGNGRTREMLEYYDAIAREYCGSMIGTLATSSTGSRALGEAMAATDADRMRAHAAHVCEMVSGTSSANTRWLQTLCEWLSIDPIDAPVIEVAEAPVRTSETRAADFATLVQSGVWPQTRITEDQRRALVEDLGLPYEAPAPTTGAGMEAEASTAPLQVGSLQAALTILQSIRPADPSLALAPAVAEQLLIAAGVDPVAASTMVSAQSALPAPTEVEGPTAPTYTPPVEAQQAAALARRTMARATEKWEPTIAERRLVKAIAAGEALSSLDLRMIEAYFIGAGNPEAAADWDAQGPTWQEWHAMGGQPMRDWVGVALDGEPDGAPAETVQASRVKLSVPAKYEHIDFTPPAGVRDAARRALEVRETKPPSQRGMTPVGIARARDLANGRTVSPDTARRMLAYFERHESDKQGETWNEQGKGWQAWHGWGGDAGFAWARKLVKQMNAADDKGAQ